MKSRFSGSRSEHGKRLTQEFEATWAPPVDEPETTGTYLTFASFPGLDLMFESLESRRPGAQPELVAVQQESTPAGEIANATVFIPEGQKEFFLTRLGSRGRPFRSWIAVTRVDGLESGRFS